MKKHKLLILTENVCQGGKKMPTWLQSQMQKAFYEKDRYQIKLLNQCWFLKRSYLKNKYKSLFKRPLSVKFSLFTKNSIEIHLIKD